MNVGDNGERRGRWFRFDRQIYILRVACPVGTLWMGSRQRNLVGILLVGFYTDKPPSARASKPVYPEGSGLLYAPCFLASALMNYM